MGKEIGIICLIAILAVMMSSGCDKVKERVADSSIEVIASSSQDTANRGEAKTVPEKKTENQENKGDNVAENQRQEAKKDKKEENSKKVNSKSVSEKPKTSTKTGNGAR